MARPRYKVWMVAPDGRTGILLLRTGSMEKLEHDVEFVGHSAAEVALAACERSDYQGKVYVKNFDTEEWFTAHVVNGELISIVDGKVP